MLIKLRIEYTVWKLKRQIKKAFLKGYQFYEVTKHDSYCPRVIEILKSLGYEISIENRHDWLSGDSFYYEINLENVSPDLIQQSMISKLFKQKG